MATFWVTCFSNFFTVRVFTCFCHGAKFRKRVFGSTLGVVVMFHKLLFNTDFVVWSRTVSNFQAPFTFLPRVEWQARVAFQAHTKARHIYHQNDKRQPRETIWPHARIPVEYSSSLVTSWTFEFKKHQVAWSSRGGLCYLSLQRKCSWRWSFSRDLVLRSMGVFYSNDFKIPEAI